MYMSGVIKAWFIHNAFCTVFIFALKWIKCVTMVMFTHDIKMSKRDQMRHWQKRAKKRHV